MTKKISIIGLGKLGSPMVAAFASRGYRVIGVDVNPTFVKLINEGRAPIFEPGLDELLEKYKERIAATLDYVEAILNSEISFIIVPTPSEEDGKFSNKYVLEVGKEIGKVLKNKQNYHLVNLVSTVIPGSTEKELKPILEKYSKKICGKDFGLCYNPEFIALGSVIHDLLNPDFVMIGEFDKKSGDILEEFYRNICGPNIPIKRMNLINAEIAKISLNVYITNKISYANMVAELCEKFPGGDVNVIMDAIGCDSRIGHRYLKGALGYGGPCFPRDTKAFLYTANKVGLSFPLPEAVEKINIRQIERIVEKVTKFLSRNSNVGVLGLSYKPNTNVIEDSQAIEIVKRLSDNNISVMVYDPVAMENVKKVLDRKVEYANSLEECCQKNDLILITTPWEEFKKIKSEWIRGKIIIDCWKILNQKDLRDIKYICIGKYFKNEE